MASGIIDTELLNHSLLVLTMFAHSRPSVLKDADSMQTTDDIVATPSIPSHYLDELHDIFATLPLLNGFSLLVKCSVTLSPRVHQFIYECQPQFQEQDLRNNSAIASWEHRHSVELVIQQLSLPFPGWGTGSPSASHRPPKLAVFDMDSTLIEQEVIDELARTIDITPLVADITARAMAGELDFSASLRERVALLKGVRADVWDELKKVVTFAEGAEELCRALKKLGVRMAVLSGGFVEMVEWVKGGLGLDYAYANHVRSFLLYNGHVMINRNKSMFRALTLFTSRILTSPSNALIP